VIGIHGLPLVPWDEQTEPQSSGVGYCTHASVLFPTWHRPYMLLYEVSGPYAVYRASSPLHLLTFSQQVIYGIMKEEIIKKGSWDNATKKRLDDAADKWRLPYWDWAATRPDKKTRSYKVPQIAYGTTVKVFHPGGQSETPQNPMYSYGPGKPFKDFGVNLNSDRKHSDNAVSSLFLRPSRDHC
jgi:tyrosinase